MGAREYELASGSRAIITCAVSQCSCSARLFTRSAGMTPSNLGSFLSFSNSWNEASLNWTGFDLCASLARATRLANSPSVLTPNVDKALRRESFESGIVAPLSGRRVYHFEHRDLRTVSARS